MSSACSQVRGLVDDDPACPSQCLGPLPPPLPHLHVRQQLGDAVLQQKLRGALGRQQAAGASSASSASRSGPGGTRRSQQRSAAQRDNRACAERVVRSVWEQARRGHGAGTGWQADRGRGPRARKQRARGGRWGAWRRFLHAAGGASGTAPKPVASVPIGIPTLPHPSTHPPQPPGPTTDDAHLRRSAPAGRGSPSGGWRGTSAAPPGAGPAAAGCRLLRP